MKGGKRINAILSQKEQKRLRDLGLRGSLEELILSIKEEGFLFENLEEESQERRRTWK